MKVKRLITELNKMNPEADVVLHHHNGRPLLFVLTGAMDDNIVWFETDTDCDMQYQINEGIYETLVNGGKLEDLFLKFIEIGINLDMLKMHKCSYNIISDFEIYLRNKE